MVLIKEMGRSPQKVSKEPINVPFESPTMWVPGTPEHHGRIIPGDPNPHPSCLSSLLPHPALKAAEAPELEIVV